MAKKSRRRRTRRRSRRNQKGGGMFDNTPLSGVADTTSSFFGGLFGNKKE